MLVALERALDAYYDVVGEQGERGGDDPERVRTVAVDPVASAQIESLTSLREEGLRIDGRTTYYNLHLAEGDGRGRTTPIRAYFCIDSTTTRVIDTSGEDVTDPDRGPIAPVLGEFVASTDQ